MKKIKIIIKKLCPRLIRNLVYKFFYAPSKTSINDNNNLEFAEKYEKYKKYTMIPEKTFYGNLNLAMKMMGIDGIVVECGVWKGGMIAAIAEIMGKKREYFLFDSFEGLPPAKKIDGEKATDWQKDIKSPTFFDNCSADIKFSEKAMELSGANKYKIVKGWFDNTLPMFKPVENIAVLRIDGDWYDSTAQCLNNLYKYVCSGGMIIIDDYYTWEGCTKAVHDFLSKNQISDKIHESKEGICYIIKK